LSARRHKHVPFRTCIACHQKRPKRELLRVVRRPEGNIEVDTERGKLSGRGAYICPTRQCCEAALDVRKLGRALKCQVSAQDIESLRQALLPLLAEQSVGQRADPEPESRSIE